MMSRSRRIRSVTLQMLFSGIVGIVVCACGSGQPANSDHYAYRSATELALMQGTTKVAQLSAAFGNNTQPLYFTNSHRYLFAVTDSHQIAVIDTQDRQAKLVDCDGCTTVQPYAQDSVTWWADPDRIAVVDLAAPNPTSQRLREVRLPSGQAHQTTRLLAVHDDDFVVARTTRHLDAPEALFDVNMASGAVRQLGVTAANSPIRSSAVNAAGTLFAYAGYDRDNPACGEGIVGIVDLRSGATTITQPRDVPSSIRANVSRVWWTTDGELNAVYASWDCSDSDLKQIDPPSVWRYSDGAWAQAEPGPVSQALRLGNGDRLAIVPDTSVNDFKGALVLDRPAGQTRIAEDVYAIAM